MGLLPLRQPHLTILYHQVRMSPKAKRPHKVWLPTESEIIAGTTGMPEEPS